MSEPSTIQEAFAAYLRSHRTKVGMSQAQFSAWLTASGIPWSRATLGAVEARRRDVGLDEALGLANLLGKPLDRILAEGQGRLDRQDWLTLSGVDMRVPWGQLGAFAKAAATALPPSQRGWVLHPIPIPADLYVTAPSEIRDLAVLAGDRSADEKGHLWLRDTEYDGRLAEAATRLRGDGRRRPLSADDIHRLAMELWGVPAAAERDRRITEPLTSASSIGHRAHTTRAMAQELADHLKRGQRR